MLWVFGYGSLVYRPAFPYVRAEAAYITGYARRFWQGSTDHRGTEKSPGRVVTLIREVAARCAGRVYQVADEHRQAVIDQLDVREQGGYARAFVPVHRLDGEVIASEALVYMATPENPNWVGDRPLEEIARVIQSSVGPSGPNIEYLLALAASLREMGEDDPHVFALESLATATLSPPLPEGEGDGG